MNLVSQELGHVLRKLGYSQRRWWRILSSKSIKCFVPNITSLRSCKASITIHKTTRSNVQKQTKLQHTHC